MKRYAIALLCAVLVSAIVPAAAQALLLTPGLGSAARLVMDPASPRPGDTVHISLESSVFDIAASQIEWKAGGVRIVGGAGVASVDVPAGKLGSRTVVEADVVAPDGTTASAQVVIVPAEVDLLYASDSYTPPFYRGRALPSAGSQLVIQAMPRIKKPNGGFLADRDIVYTWRRDGQVLGSISGRGRSVIIIPAPYPKDALAISVEARSLDAALSAAASLTIPAAPIALRLYEDHPLLGIRFGQALGTTTAIAETEMTFAAIPYFASARSASDDVLAYEWEVNGKRIATSGTAKNEVALGSARDARDATARILLSLSHATNVLLDASGMWRVTLGQNPVMDIFNNPSQR